MWIYTINGNRIIVLHHLPHYRGYVIYVIKVPDAKQVHNLDSYFIFLMSIFDRHLMWLNNHGGSGNNKLNYISEMLRIYLTNFNPSG
jgi:hypothetical protein